MSIGDKNLKAFSGRLRRAIVPHYSVASFAKEIQVSPSGLRKWLAAKSEPSRDNLIAIAEKAGVSLNWLATGEGEMFQHKLKPVENKERPIPVVGFASCGLSMGWQNEEPLGYKILSPQNIDDKEAFAILTKGKSMVPEGIAEGSTCIISPAHLPIVGQPVYIRSIYFDKGRKHFVSSIKRFDLIKDHKVYLKGWLEPDETGRQEPFEEQRDLKTVDLLAPVVCIFSPECPPKTVEDCEGAVFDESAVDFNKLAQCLEAVEKLGLDLESGRKAKIVILLYKKGFKKGKIDNSFLNEIVSLVV